MTPTTYAIAVVAAMVIFALLTAYDRTRQQRDHHIIRADRAEAALADEGAWSRILALGLHQEITESVRERQSLEDALVEAGREAATHADHLTAVMDAVAEGKPLTLVKGGQR